MLSFNLNVIISIKKTVIFNINRTMYMYVSSDGPECFDVFNIFDICIVGHI